MEIKKELKLGIFVIMVLVATFVVINILRGADVLGREIKLEGRFDNVETLVASAPVQIRGFAAGRVNSVEYDKTQDNFKVICSVNKDFKIPVDSKMMLYSTSIMGGKGIRIQIGTSEECVKDGSLLQTGSEADLMSALGAGIEPMLNKINSLMDSLTVTVAGINDVLNEQNKKNMSSSIAHLNMTLKEASELAESLNGKSDEINEFVDNLTMLSEQLAPMAEAAGKSLDNIAVMTNDLKDSDIKGTIDKVRDLSGTLNTSINQLTTPLDSLLNDADSLIKSIKENPKKYIKITVF